MPSLPTSLEVTKVGLKSSAVLPGVPLSSVTTTWLAVNATVPVFVTL